MKSKSIIGLFAGLAVATIVLILPLEGLPWEGQKCLALSLMAVIWWAMSVVHPGYTSVLLLASYVVFKVAPGNVVFGLWTTPLVYLVVGGYLVAAAVRDSGLGKRIAFNYALRFLSDYKSIIIGAYALGFLLSFLIPHPWPRSFLIMSVLMMIIKDSHMPKADAANVGLAVFAGSVSTSAILLTGDSIVNVVTVGMANAEVSWLKWAWYMGVPGVIAAILTLCLQLAIYKPAGEFKIDKDALRTNIAELGSLTPVEMRCLFWIGLAVIAWVTDSLHGIHPGWIALFCAIGLALPRVGGVLGPHSWNDVAIATLFFLTAALAIGTVGKATGMNAWLASVLLPSQAPTNPYLFAGFVSIIAVILHICLGSVLAVMGIAIPTLITFGSSAGLPPIVIAMLVYTAISIHFILPFHHMNVLVGLGEKQGLYGDKEVMRLGIPLTVVVFIVTVCVQIPWWKIIGLI